MSLLDCSEKMVACKSDTKKPTRHSLHHVGQNNWWSLDLMRKVF